MAGGGLEPQPARHSEASAVRQTTRIQGEFGRMPKKARSARLSCHCVRRCNSMESQAVANRTWAEPSVLTVRAGSRRARGSKLPLVR